MQLSARFGALRARADDAFPAGYCRITRQGMGVVVSCAERRVMFRAHMSISVRSFEKPTTVNE